MRSLLFALSLLMPVTAVAEGISVHHAYVRSSGAMAKAAAAFMVIHNDSDKDVTLIAADTDVARKIELHTHIIEDDVAKMREIKGGITIPAGGFHELKRGADHVMFMGLTEKLVEDEMVKLTLEFEGQEPMVIEVVVDNDRKAEDDHGSADHSEHKNH